MVASYQLVQGMVIRLKSSLYRVEEVNKGTSGKNKNRMELDLKNITKNLLVHQAFDLEEELEEIRLIKHALEFLYKEGKDYLFLDLDNLNQVLISYEIVDKNALFLKEGIEVEAFFYEDKVVMVELPQFLELMISETSDQTMPEEAIGSSSMKSAFLETGAEIVVPQFIEIGDVIKVDIKNKEYIQRV